jgi:hypothetical protein
LKQVKVTTEYVDDEVDHLRHCIKMNFTQILNKRLFESRVVTDGRIGKLKDDALKITEWIKRF